MKTNNLIQELSFAFALQIIGLYKKLIAEKEYVLSRQLLKSGTSIGANVEEGIAAQSRKDFINKMSIAAKEARETRYWLRLLNEGEIVKLDLKNYLGLIHQIINILTRIILTSQQRMS